MLVSFIFFAISIVVLLAAQMLSMPTALTLTWFIAMFVWGLTFLSDLVDAARAAKESRK